MKAIVRVLSLIIAASAYCPARALVQAPLDGPSRTFQDKLLDNLVGTWLLTRTIRGKQVQNTLDTEWVLNHQFLRLHMKDVAEPAQYEAIVYIGYDDTSERYVVHWIDVYGGRFSETLGFGRRDEDSIALVFEYPDGPFHNTLAWTSETKTWTFVMEQKNAAGQWVLFARDVLRRAG